MFENLRLEEKSLGEFNPFEDAIHFLKNIDRVGVGVGTLCWMIGLAVGYFEGQFDQYLPYISTLQNLEPQYTIIAFGTTFMSILLSITQFYVISHNVSSAALRHFFLFTALVSLEALSVEAIVPIDSSANVLLYSPDGQKEFYSNLSTYSRIHIRAFQIFLVGSLVHWAGYTVYSLLSRNVRGNFQIRLLMVPAILLLGEASGWSIEHFGDDDFLIERAKDSASEYLMFIFSLLYWFSFDTEASDITLWCIDAKKVDE